MTAAVDAFIGASRKSQPFTVGQNVTNGSDTVDLTNVSRALYVGVAGDLCVVMLGGMTLTFKNAPVGWHNLRVTRVMATGTTAQQIIAVS